MLPPGYDCSSPQNNMAIARNIVQSINRGIVDFLEVVELITNPAELTAELSDNVEGLSYVIGSTLELLAWFQDTVAEFYSASYTEEAEDEIACAIFCHLQDECSLSYQDLLDIYSDIATVIIPTGDDLLEIVDFFIGLALSIDTTTVATIHYWALQMMRWGGLFSWSGIGSFESDLRAWSNSWDYTFEDCDCSVAPDPTTIWALYTDFQISPGGYTFDLGSEFEFGRGIRGGSNSGNSRVRARLADLGAAYTLKQFSVVCQRQTTGGTPSGTDTDTSASWVLPNFSGTALQNGTVAFKGRDSNAVQSTWTGDTGTMRQSLQFDSTCWNLPTVTRFYMRRVAVWGEAGPGDTKPPNAVWVNDLSTTQFLQGL
jgi:hypothetical protein